jgi:hypothetical protein
MSLNSIVAPVDTPSHPVAPSSATNTATTTNSKRSLDEYGFFLDSKDANPPVQKRYFSSLLKIYKT